MATIFIVEDDKKIREELSLFLNKNGYEVKSVCEFSNVISKIIDSKADIVLLILIYQSLMDIIYVKR